MKKCVVILLFLFILVTAFCGCKEESPVVDIKADAVPYYNYETDHQLGENPPFERSVTKGRDGYYYLNDGYLYFADANTNSAIILCNKPNCLHNEVAFNTDCNALIVTIGDKLVYNDGYLYYMSTNLYEDDGCAFMRIATDGSGQRECFFSSINNTKKWTVHRGYLYNAYREYKRENQFENVNNSRLVLEKVSINNPKDVEVIFDSVDFLQDASFHFLAAFDNYLYYNYDYYIKAENTNVEKMMCYDILNKTEKEVVVTNEETGKLDSITYIYPLDKKLVFKLGTDVYSCDLNFENIKKVLTVNYYDRIVTDGVFLYADNFTYFLHSEQLSIEKASSRILKVYDSEFRQIDTLDFGDFQRGFQNADEKKFLCYGDSEEVFCYDKTQIGNLKEKTLTKIPIEVIS